MESSRSILGTFLLVFCAVPSNVMFLFKGFSASEIPVKKSVITFHLEFFQKLQYEKKN